MAGGRPTIYSEELAERICNAIASSDKGLVKLCEENPDFPTKETLFQWKYKYKEFSDRYYDARRNQAEVFAEGTIEIANEKPYYTDEKGISKIDAGHVAWQKLNVNTRQWHASKLAPKIYGDQKQIEQLQEENAKVKADLEALKASLKEKYQKEY